MHYRRFVLSAVLVLGAFSYAQTPGELECVRVKADQSDFSQIMPGSQVVVVILPTEENKDSGKVMNDVFVPAVDQERHEIIFVLPQEWAQMLAAADKEGRARIFPHLSGKTNR